MRRLARACATGLLIGGLGVLLALTPLGAAVEERLGLGWLFWLRGPLPAPEEAVVVGLDPDSAARLGLPEKTSQWPRTVHAHLIGRLAAAGASVIVFDVIFGEPRNSAEDTALARAIAAAGRVVLLEYLYERFHELPAGAGARAGLLAVKQRRPPLPQLARAAAGSATFPLPRENERVSQFFAFTSELGQRPTLPALALQRHALPALGAWTGLLAAAGAPGATIAALTQAARPAGAETLVDAMIALRGAFRADPELGARLRSRLAGAALDPATRRLLAALIALYDGPDGRYLNFYGPPGQVRTIPVHRLLDDGADAAPLPDLAGKVVFIGRSELLNNSEDGFATVFPGPKAVRVSGVEIAATAFANLLEGRQLEPAGAAASLAWIGAFGLIVSLIARLLPAPLAVPLAIGFAGAGYLAAQLAFDRANLWLPVTVPLLVQLPLGLLVGLLLQYRAAQQARANVSRGLRYYLPERIATGFAEAPVDPSALKEQLFAACMVTDAERFASLAEGMAPDQLSAFLDRYFALLFGIVERHGGVVTDVVGDGTTCIWTAARTEPGCCRNACLAALAIAQAVVEFNRASAPLALPTRIGLNAGRVMVGNVGGSGHFAYSVVGDSVNTAARLESLNKQLGTRLLAAADMVDGLEDIVTRPLGRFLVVGRHQPVRLVELICRQGEARDEHLLLASAAALADLESGRLAEAAGRFEAILAVHPGDGPARFHLAYCRRLLSETPVSPEPGLIRLERK
jgi:adenylate cyclase